MTTKEFIQYASESPELCEKMGACTTPEEGYAIAKGEGLTDDIDTFQKIISEIKVEAEKLSENDLEKISAAGTSIVTYTCTYTVVTSAGAVAAAGGSAAASI